MDKNKRLDFIRGLEKLKASGIKSPDYTSPLNDEVLKIPGEIVNPDEITRIKGMTQKIDTATPMRQLSGNEFTNKINKLIQNKPTKKILGALPFAGVGMAALSGDPAMAAEELAQDAMGPAGLAYEAIRPETAGNPEDDAMMFAERNALENYENSPAAKDKFAKIRASLGLK